MTDKPTPTKEQIQRACDLANAPNDALLWHTGHYGVTTIFTALADTIAQLDAMQAERDEARSERAAANIRASELKLGFDKATADLGAIDEIAAMYGWGKPEADIGKKTVAAIAAPYRVETDPLVEALRTIVPIIHCEGDETAAEAVARQLRSDPRWLEIGRAA